MRRGVLKSNPVREITAANEGHGRTVWYDLETAQRVIQSITDPMYRAREAFMCGTGADWSDTQRLRVSDVNMQTLKVRLRGSETPWRNRVVRITEAWTIPHFLPALVNKLPDAPVFMGGSNAAIERHHLAVAAAKAEGSTLHDWRHTYAVNALKRGEKETVVAHQLGHHNTNLVRSRYGRFIPNATDYEQNSSQLVAPNTAPVHQKSSTSKAS